MSEAPALDVVGLEKVYDDGTVALRGASLRIPPGCFFGLLGPNGSGKSTLIGMASGLIRAPRGRILAFGHDVVADYHHARLELGLAAQDIHLDRFLTAQEVLVYHGRYFGMSQADARTRAAELLGVFDLAARGHTKPNRLSGGMRRRLLIARALMHRPRLLILDEPTAGVDVALRMELWAYLRNVHREERTTILLTTHYLEEAEELCELVAFIHRGEITAEGSVEDLVARFGGGRLEDAYLEAMR
ncbi:MAG: ABC transporter ATP-binding protein [Solirubrobacterales bacterium]|nr:ABC transporter ATP-binding protein [Solirubrobacterales bacterium]